MSAAVKSIPDQKLFNRLSPMQADIIRYLKSVRALGPDGDRIGQLPRTGQIIVGIGRGGDSSAYASVSRSLKRLCAAGIVEAFTPSIRTRGKGFHYALAAIGAGNLTVSSP